VKNIGLFASAKLIKNHELIICYLIKNAIMIVNKPAENFSGENIKLFL